MNDNGEERTDIIVLLDEDGNEHDFALVDRFQVDAHEYAVLAPIIYLGEDSEDEDEDEDEADFDVDDEAFIFRIEHSGEDETLVEVDDDAEWNTVAAQLEQRMQVLDQEDDDDLY